MKKLQNYKLVQTIFLYALMITFFIGILLLMYVKVVFILLVILLCLHVLFNLYTVLHHGILVEHRPFFHRGVNLFPPSYVILNTKNNKIGIIIAFAFELFFIFILLRFIFVWENLVFLIIMKENSVYFLLSTYPHLPHVRRSLCSARKKPSPHFGHERFFAFPPSYDWLRSLVFLFFAAGLSAIFI